MCFSEALGVDTMKNNFIILIMVNIIIVITMTGCGGEEDSSPQEVVADPIQSSPGITNEETITTSELMSTPDFDFISNADLTIILPATPLTSVSYFVNVCTDFSKENDEVKINYDSCKLRTSLKNQQQLFNLSLSTTELLLIAQIWPIENGAQPITLYWNIAESGNSWKIAI